MIDLRRIRDERDDVERRLRSREPSIDLSPILALDATRRELIAEVEQLKAERNQGSEEVGRRKREGKPVDELLARMSVLSNRIGELDEVLRRTASDMDDLLARLPNVPHPSVPIGPKESYLVMRSVGEPPSPDVPRRSHLELAEAKGLLDFPRAARMAGARFPMYVGAGARLEMALIQFMFFHHARRDYVPVLPPFLANARSFYVSSQLPKFEEDIYHCERDGLYLNPTAESLLVNLHQGEILEAEDLPKRYVAYTPCFRREAGSYGEEERGLIRVHQFNKVEMFTFSPPERSYEELDRLVADASRVLDALGLHYRVVLLPTQDMAQQSSKTIDLEVYLPAQGRYYEVSSCSNCEAYQARRGNIRYRPAPKAKPEFVHTLNGSGLATSRLMAAILENNQQPDGTVRIPDVLQSMVGAEVL
ncbi:MAG TPA: serine--tRNA ligase [Candidatus Acetothermia bacterium]|nr:serine--tRNA ligase [Candidatus Acetothermia bacterium]